jgi:hypothetical protein
VPNQDFVAVAAGAYYSLGLKADGSIVAWGYNNHGQVDVPTPNVGFIAFAAGADHNLAIRGTPGDYDGDGDFDLLDYIRLSEHLAGPAIRPEPPGWHVFNLDPDFDLDLGDFAEWQNLFGTE